MKTLFFLLIYSTTFKVTIGDSKTALTLILAAYVLKNWVLSFKTDVTSLYLPKSIIDICNPFSFCQSIFFFGSPYMYYITTGYIDSLVRGLCFISN